MKPKTYITNDYIAGEIGKIKIMCSKERFTADLGSEQIDVPVEKLQTGTDDLWKNYVAGLLWIIGTRTTPEEALYGEPEI